jgi:SpoVK/Ycf46/Vps4 family AAA+-type ATPase
MLRALGPVSFPAVNDASHLRLVMTGAEKAAPYRPRRKIDDIRGIATVKRNLADIIEAIRATRAGRPGGWRGGVLFYGPSGCGKVFSAEIIASELDVPMFVFDLAAGWDRKTFEQTLRDALASENELVALHFENVDSPAAAGLRTPTALEMLDAADAAGKVVVTASAIFPWQAGAQLVQTDRLARVLLILPPDAPSRALFILERVVGRATLSDDDLDWVVQHTEGHSFTDLKALLESAFHIATQEPPSPLPILSREALRIARREVGPSTASWLSQAGHHALMNEQGGMYDDLLQYFHIRQRH